jgi:hypothetical protein
MVFKGSEWKLNGSMPIPLELEPRDPNGTQWEHYLVRDQQTALLVGDGTACRGFKGLEWMLNGMEHNGSTTALGTGYLVGDGTTWQIK